MQNISLFCPKKLQYLIFFTLEGSNGAKELAKDISLRIFCWSLFEQKCVKLLSFFYIFIIVSVQHAISKILFQWRNAIFLYKLGGWNVKKMTPKQQYLHLGGGHLKIQTFISAGVSIICFFNLRIFLQFTPIQGKPFRKCPLNMSWLYTSPQIIL